MSYAESFQNDLSAIFKNFMSNHVSPFLETLLIKMLHYENKNRLSINEIIELMKKNSNISSPLKSIKSLSKEVPNKENEEKTMLKQKSIIAKSFKDQFPLKLDSDWEKFVMEICKNSEINTPEVKQTMTRVNRRNFVLSDTEAFIDSSRLIGWATTISQPSMQAATLDILTQFILPSKKALDIGTGSGYMTACIAEMMGPKGMVYSVDHFSEILIYAKNSINKGNTYLLDHIVFVEADGAKYASYDVIHIGGAVEDMPKEIINQLVEGGLIFAPVGKESQRIFIWEKEKDGHLKMEGKLEVQYGPLMSKEEHLERIKQFK